MGFLSSIRSDAEAALRVVGHGAKAMSRSWSTYRKGRWEADEDSGWLYSDTTSGVPINRYTAYTLSHWYRAMNLISGTVAKTPLEVIDCRNGSRKKAKRHPGWMLLSGHGKPNDMTLKYHFKQTLTAHAVGHGGGFAYIYRDLAGRPTELLQLRPDRTFLCKEDGRYIYTTSIGGDYGDTGSEIIKMLPENVLHIHGLGWDGLTGYSLMEYAANTIGGALAKEHYGAGFFRNAASPSVAIKTSKKMSDGAYNRLRNSWQELRTGLDQAHKPVILEDGEEVVPLSINASDSQLIESMENDPLLICNFTGLPPHKLGVKGFNSYNSLEIMSQDFLDDAIDPWFIPWEEECNDKLLTEDQKAKESHCFEYKRKALIRVDHAKRMAGNRTALGGHPFLEVNEVRVAEGEDPKEGFDFIPVPLNMQQTPGEEVPGKDTEPVDENGEDRSEAIRELLTQTTKRMAGRLDVAKKRSSKMDASALEEKHGEIIRSAFAPVLALLQSNHSPASVCTELIRSCDQQHSEDWVENVVSEVVAELLD